LKEPKKRLVRFAQIAGTRNSIKDRIEKKICRIPGLPKLVRSALKPVIVVLIDSIYTQGRKQLAIIPNAAITPI
jgi:hypothetical protein